MARKLTIRQRKFVKRLVELGNGTQAALDSYNAKNTNVAGSIASENLTKPNVRVAITEAFERDGLTLDYVSNKLKDAMDAGVGVKAKNSDTIRAAELLLKIFGAFPGRQTESLRINIRERIKGMNYGELEREYRNVETISGGLRLV